MGKRAPMQRVPAGTVFYSPEQAAEVLFMLKEGQVRLYQLSADGKAITTAVVEAGTFFGEMAIIQLAIFRQLPYTALRDGVFAHPTLAESLNNLFVTI